jgi:hypothetical protein
VTDNWEIAQEMADTMSVPAEVTQALSEICCLIGSNERLADIEALVKGVFHQGYIYGAEAVLSK